MIDPANFVTRGTVAQYGRDFESHFKNILIEKVKEWSKKEIPEFAYQKFISYEDAHDMDFESFQEKIVRTDWLENLSEELDDAFFYTVLHQTANNIRGISKP
jgi:hypothetical protein